MNKTICTTHRLLQEQVVEVEDQDKVCMISIFGEGHILLSLCRECAERFANDPTFN